MCHLILSMCKVFFFFDFNFADWLDFHHICLFQASHACGCKSILHSSFTSDLLVYAACSPASPVWHVYQSSPPACLDVQHHICIWNLFFFSFWSARLLPFLHQKLFKGRLLPWHLQELFFQLCQGCAVFFNFLFFFKYSTSQFLAA